MTLDELRARECFEDELLEGLDLQRFDLAGKDLSGCTFRKVNLQESRWSRARLEDCVFEECDLTRMLPADLRARGVRFRGCKVMGVEWTTASVDPQLSFEDCTLRYSSFVAMNLRATRFVRCQATEVSFVDVDLTEADFSASDLTGSTFERAILQGADLSTARGAFFDPAKNRVKGARVAVETAVLLAESFGMKVGDDHDDIERRAPKARGRRGR